MFHHKNTKELCMKKQIPNYSLRTMALAIIAIVIVGFVGFIAVKKLVRRPNETVSERFERIIGLGLKSMESAVVESRIDDLALTAVKEANFSDDDKQLLKNIVTAMLVKFEEPCLFGMVDVCSKEVTARIAKILKIEPAVIEEFDKKEQELSDKRMRGAIEEPSFRALMDQLENEPQYAAIVQVRAALKESEKLYEQFKKDPRVQDFYKNLEPKIVEALLKALQ